MAVSIQERATSVASRRSWSRAALAGCLSIASCFVLAAPIPPPSHRSPDGIVRVAGNAQMAPIVKRWQAGFGRTNPDIRIVVELKGSDVGIASLYTGKADVTLLGREITESEEKAFEWVYRYKPTRIEIMTGSLDQPGKSPALVVFVHEDNPLKSISLKELGALFGADGASDSIPIRRWGQLGLTASWDTRPISLYLAFTESGTGAFFRQRAVNGKNTMNWAALIEFRDPVHLDHAPDDSGARILDALARDRDGLAISHLQPQHAGVRPVPVRLDNGKVVRAAKSSVLSRSYPLTRSMHAYINRPTGAAIDPQVREFLRYVLAVDGQRAVAAEAGYLPLSRTLVVQQQRNLE